MSQYDVDFPDHVLAENVEGVIKCLRYFHYDAICHPTAFSRLDNPSKNRGAALSSALMHASIHNKYGMMILLFDKKRASYVIEDLCASDPEIANSANGLNVLKNLLAFENDTGTLSTQLRDLLSGSRTKDWVDSNELKTVIGKIDQEFSAYTQAREIASAVEPILNAAPPRPVRKM